jgi:FkbM family methyltransferase
MADKVPLSLFLKSRVVGTPLEMPAKRVKWWLGARQRWRHPELWEVYLEDLRMPAVLQRLLTPDSCGADVGAHIGSFLSLLRRFAPNGEHFAFEPSRTKSAWLKRKFGDVQIFSAAVGEKAGRALFEENPVRPGFSRLVGATPDRSQLPTYEVEVCRLDDVLRDIRRLDLLKLDIEGNEFSALRGAVTIIKKLRPAILFECGTEGDFERMNLDRKEMFDFITQDLNCQIYTYADFLFDRGPLGYDEFRRCGIYPFRAFNFLALPAG